MPRYFTTSLEISPGFLLTALPTPCSVRVEELSPEILVCDVRDNIPEFLLGMVPLPPRFMKLNPGDAVYVLEAIGVSEKTKKVDFKFYRISISE